jgi:hypothetical protein
MTFKEIFQLNRLVYQVKLDQSENDFFIFSDEEKTIQEKINEEKFSESEWNQEYELIYQSYVLE